MVAIHHGLLPFIVIIENSKKNIYLSLFCHLGWKAVEMLLMLSSAFILPMTATLKYRYGEPTKFLRLLSIEEPI